MAKTSDYQASQGKFKAAKLPELEVVDNHYSDRDYVIRFEIPEFNCVCPKTGLPDFATLTIRYVPRARCVELKSLKYYVTSYRSVGIFQEHATAKIADDLFRALDPQQLSVTTVYDVRGGFETTCTVALPAGERGAGSGER